MEGMFISGSATHLAHELTSLNLRNLICKIGTMRKTASLDCCNELKLGIKNWALQVGYTNIIAIQLSWGLKDNVWEQSIHNQCLLGAIRN